MPYVVSQQQGLDRCTTFTGSEKGWFQSATLDPSALKQEIPYDFLTFLGIAQNLRIQFLSLTWDGERTSLGMGGSAEIHQRLVDRENSYAFKCLKSRAEPHFEALIAEISILGQQFVREHNFINRIQGICWDIDSETENIRPVLAFEKSPYEDLEKFRQSDLGKNLPFGDRVRLCGQVASAVADMHLYGIVHGDIKPANILIFEDPLLHRVAKVIDFGYSTWLGDSDVVVYMPRSNYWTAPEWHHRGFTRTDAFKMDVYSFGVLCLWLLFYSKGEREHCAFFKDLDTKTALTIACEILGETSQIDNEQRQTMQHLFQKSLAIDPTDRCSDFEHLRDLLDPSTKPSDEKVGMLRTNVKALVKEFRIVPPIIPLYRSHHLLRVQIARCLEDRAHALSVPKTSVQCAAFELSLCFTLGFGVEKDDLKACAYLEQAGKRSYDLLAETSLARNMVETSISYGRWSIDSLAGRQGHATKLCAYDDGITKEASDVAMVHLEKEVANIESVLGDKHQIVGILKNSIARLAIIQKNWDLACDLETRLLEWSQKALGYFDAFTLNCKVELGWIWISQSRLDGTELLLTQVLVESLLELRSDHYVTVTSIDFLLLVLHAVGKWEKAQRLFKQTFRILDIAYGPEHGRTRVLLSSMSRNDQHKARFEDFLQDILQQPRPRDHIIPMRLNEEKEHRKSLPNTQPLLSIFEHRGMEIGRDHPSILRRLRHLVVHYQEQERWKESESIAIEVIWLDERCGSSFEWLIADLRRLGSLYRCQKRWKDAGTVLMENMKMRERYYGADHPSTVTGILDIVQIYMQQGKWQEAESLIVPVVAKLKRIIGETDTHTIRAMRYLALIWHVRNNQSEALSLMSKVVCLLDERRTPSHPTSIACRCTVNEWLSEAHSPSAKHSNDEFNGDSPRFHKTEASAVESVIKHLQRSSNSTSHTKKSGPFDNVHGLKESLYKGKITRLYVEQKISFEKSLLDNPRMPPSTAPLIRIKVELLNEYALL